MAQFSRFVAQIDAILDDVEGAKGNNESLTAAMLAKADIADLTAETAAREAADAALQEAINAKDAFGVGTLLTRGSDLFTLPTGKYYRNSNVIAVLNLPAEVTTAFYCEIVNTIAENRRKIYLYPATIQTAMTFYTCLETGNGYGTWYKFSGEAVS